MKFWNAALPELQEYQQQWTMAMLQSPFRADFSAEYGDLMFVNAEIALKAFSPAIIPQMQQENDPQPADALQERSGRRPPPGRLEGGGAVVQG